jgi:nucleotide-binding universal stress UspA family protein
MKQVVRMQLWPDVTLRLVSCDEGKNDVDRRLNDAFAYCRQHGYEPEVNQRSGSAGEEILAEAAEWDADLMVLGTSRSSVLSRAVFGTTALHVIRNADRPLFLAR